MSLLLLFYLKNELNQVHSLNFKNKTYFERTHFLVTSKLLIVSMSELYDFERIHFLVTSKQSGIFPFTIKIIYNYY